MIVKAARSSLSRRMRTPPITPRGEGAATPITDEQRHMWLHLAFYPDAPLYNEPFTITRHGPFDLAAFRSAFDELVRRHEAWRTTFQDIDGEVFQIVHEAMASELDYVDLAGIARPQDRELEALLRAEADARRPFDLERGPLFRGWVAKFSENEHRLYLTVHHLIFDGVSINRILMPELSALHAVYRKGWLHSLPAPAVQYGDYAVWQQHTVRPRARDAQIDYWRNALGGELPVLQLPADRSRATGSGPAGSMQTFEIDPELVAGLKALARANGVTLYMAVLATFCALLHRYSGQEDIIVGGVADTRRRSELQRTMGCFINSVALRSRPTHEMPFRDYLHQIRDVVIGAIENSETPFEQVVRALGVRSEAGVSPIFQAMFTLDPPAPNDLDGWDLAIHVTPCTTKYDLYTEISDGGDRLIVRMIYATQLFDAQTIIDMGLHWKQLISGAIASPDTRLVDLPMMNPIQARTMLRLSTGPNRPIPPRTLPEQVRAVGASRPRHPAVRCDGTSWTYEQLARRVDELSLHLRLGGVGRGDHVAVCMTRSADTVAVPLAIMQTGATYLPLDPSFPASRLDAIVRDAAPVMVVTNRVSAGRLPGWGIMALVCDDLPAAHPDAPPAAPGSAAPSDLAYLIYTSGSTGIPKGVEVEHRSVINLLQSMRRAPGFDDHDVLLAITTPTFDISVLELFLPLVSGGTVVVATSAEVADPALQAAAIARSRCTVMQGTPATWRSLFSIGWTGRPGLKILCGGEALPRDLADRILACGMTLWNMYGPTETTVWSSIEKVDRERITIGRPIDNTHMIILDDAGRCQPPNTLGHLLIGGAGLARGYRDEALTRTAFISLNALAGERFYRTGDMALMRRDGRCEWFGRRDGQVKVRGYRIDLGDVESALASHPEIAAAAVKTFEEEGQAALAAYYVPRHPPGPTAAGLRDHLRQILPSYMIPGRYAAIGALPLSTSGKIDRKALPAIASADREVPDYEPPSGDIEHRLAAIWSEALSIHDIGATDDFQELGGHSILAARVMGKIAGEFGRKLPISTLLRAPTIRTMATLLEQQEAVVRMPDTVVIQEGLGQPLFWIDAVPNLRPGYYRAMAAAIGADQPVIGLPIDLDRHNGLNGNVTIADLASDLADRIRAYPSSGRIILGGWCNGGILAYAVAAEFERRRDQVALLILLDTHNPTRYRTVAARLRHQIAQFSTLPIGYKMPFAIETVEAYVSRFRRRRWPDRSETSELLDLNDRFMRILKLYDPVPFAGRLVLLQPREGKIDYAAGWRGLAGNLHSEDVDGGHISILDDPHVRMLGRRIAAHIAKAQRASRGSAKP